MDLNVKCKVARLLFNKKETEGLAVEFNEGALFLVCTRLRAQTSASQKHNWRKSKREII
jgi:hypothetical protein